jgi:gamma-glutamyltranspeptidase / glutathione hydrolase
VKDYLRTSSVCQVIWLGCFLGGCVNSHITNLETNPITVQTATNASVLPSPPLQPEVASGLVRNKDVITQKTAVASANPLASQAGLDILQAGGSAVDAAIAVQMVLGLVEPQSSGIGGGAFLLHSTGVGVKRRLQAFDGRETAPALADEALFLNAQGKPLPFFEAVVGGRSVGTPGTLNMLAMAHQQYGKLPWAHLFEPAIYLAKNGFAVSPRLHASLLADAYLTLDPVARTYFYQADGAPHPIGHVLRNPDLADVMQRIAKEGVNAFYKGDVAQAIVDKVQQHPKNPGRLRLQDLAQYQAKEREALCFDHAVRATVFEVCGFPPPSSGAIAIGQILGLLQYAPNAFKAPVNGELHADWLHDYAQASRLAFADRAQYVADPDFVEAPAEDWRSLLDPAYLKQRAQLMGPTSLKQTPAGIPLRAQKSAYAPMPYQAEFGTSHISIVDDYGNALAMTTTIENAFGARQMVRGFLLNNELTDFSFVPRDAQGRPIANRVQPNKRPRSSMSPTLVFDKATGELLMSTGSPGGEMIIHFTTKTLIGVLHWGMSPQQAIDLPNFGALGDTMVVEEKRFSADTLQSLRARGGEVRELALTSGIQAIVKQPKAGHSKVWISGTDPRREGVVLGQ